MKVKNKIGRPSKYKKNFCNLLLNHMAKGLSFTSFAGAMRVAVSQLYVWLKKHPEFQDAYKIARPLCSYYWERVYNLAALGHTKVEIDGREVSIKPNAALLIFGMKNRCGWSDRVNQTVENIQPVVIKKRDGTEVILGHNYADEKSKNNS